MREALPREVAERFLARLTGQSSALGVLLAASALSPVADVVRAFARELPLVARILSSHTRVERVESDGVVRGRLDVPATLRRKLAGGPSRVVSRVRERHFELPENVLLVVTADRLIRILVELGKCGAISKGSTQGWAEGFLACAEQIRHTLTSTRLREVSRAPLQSFHEHAARAARHPAYGLALRLHEAMEAMETKDPTAIARLVADGALQPLREETRFEIAVLIRLGRSLEEALKGRGFAMSRALVDTRRQHVFAFVLGGSCVRIHYNQVIFKELGPRDLGIRHYFGGSGRSRPDMTIEILQDEKRRRAVVVEVKFSEKDDESYLKTGYHEALVYRAEYDKDLTGWPKAILVVSSLTAIKGVPRRDHDVIAVSWKDWVPSSVLEGLLDGLEEADAGQVASRNVGET
ncbi:hypothetical protein BE11_36870 [Sorangium cellulosum]|nr:hypothetical protein BE11_36870 [Sorangium cellulosum]